MKNLEEIIQKEVEAILIERGIVVPLSLFMPDFSCPCEPDDSGRLYVLNYKLPDPVRGIEGVVVYMSNSDNLFKLETCPIKSAGKGLGTRQHAVYNSLKRKVCDYYLKGLKNAGWSENCENINNPSFIPPWSFKS